MAPDFYHLPKIVDNRFQQYLTAPRGPQDQGISRHALKVSQNGKVDIYSNEVYDFGDNRFPGKGGFSNFCSQPIKIDGVTYHTAEHYLRVMACEDPKEAVDVFFDHSISGGPKKINNNFYNARPSLMQTVIRAKLTQHPDNVGELLATGNQYMIYANRDEYYGTGFKGGGKNLLGEMYMDARDEVLRVILQNKKIGKIVNPTPEQIRELAQEFEGQHPENIAKTVKEMTGKDMVAIIDVVYPGGHSNIQTPKGLNPGVLNSIRTDSRYKSHQCSDGYEYLRPHLSKNYHDQINDRYQALFYEKEVNGVSMVHSIKEYRGTNPFYAPIDFLFRGVGPIPGPAPLAVISAIVCFGLIASGVGAIGVAAVAITFSAVSGAVQAYKSAKENGLDLQKTIVATLLGAVSGMLAPWPGLGPIMSALYVKGVEKGLKLGKKAMDIHFPKKETEEDAKQSKDRGVNVVQQQGKGVEVVGVNKETEKVQAATGARMVNSTDKETRKKLGSLAPQATVRTMQSSRQSARFDPKTKGRGVSGRR
ncbi:MAG: NADAR family protein [Rickettsiales bacterium]|nr:NADAR family protein [Rickettsiales bacterium]